MWLIGSFSSNISTFVLFKFQIRFIYKVTNDGNVLQFLYIFRLAESFGNEGTSLIGDHELNSTVDTGASSADDEENVPFSFDLSNRVY